MTQYEVGVSSK